MIVQPLIVTYPMSKLRGLHLSLPLLGRSGEDTKGRVTSGNYPYDAPKWTGGPQRKETQALHVSTVTHAFTDLCM